MTKDLKYIAKKLAIKDGDIVAIKNGTWLAQRDKIDMLGGYLGKSSRAQCLVIVVDDLDDVDRLDERIMNKHGWFKRDE